jgi:hypothetical protein
MIFTTAGETTGSRLVPGELDDDVGLLVGVVRLSDGGQQHVSHPRAPVRPQQAANVGGRHVELRDDRCHELFSGRSLAEELSPLEELINTSIDGDRPADARVPLRRAGDKRTRTYGSVI